MMKQEQIEVGKTYVFPRENSHGLAPFVTVRGIEPGFQSPLVALRSEWGPKWPDVCTTLANMGLDDFAKAAICEATPEELARRNIPHPGYEFIGHATNSDWAKDKT